MTYIVNLSTTHDYSIDETIEAFVRICNQYSNGCLQSMPGFFQSFTNRAWVKAQLYLNYASLIEPYKLGKISTDQFLDNLARIFYFIKDMDKSQRNALLARAWSSSIKLSSNTTNRLPFLFEKAGDEPIYLISNTNELDIRAILNLFQEKYPDLDWDKAADVSITSSKKPILILRPNVYLCLSYRFGGFKEQTPTTASLLEEISAKCPGPKILVSQYDKDRNKGRLLVLDSIFTAEEFYKVPELSLSSKLQ